MDAGTTPAEEAHDALRRADEAMVHFDVEALVVHLSAAMRGFTAAGDNRRAAMICVRLGNVMANALGNLTAGRAWFTRATRLVKHEEPCIEQGWVAVAAMGCEVPDPAVLLAAAELALDRARRFGDVNLETKALADGGLAHVQAGRLEEGMALLDEAMALACGPADDVDSAGKSVCSFFTACYYAADFERAASWADLLRAQGLIGVAPVAPIFLSSHCETVRATLLSELGRWSEAEAVLTRAIAAFEAVMPSAAWHPVLGLAELRIRQGRLADAETLLLTLGHGIDALLPDARLHLARGDAELARTIAQRGLRAVGEDRLRAADLLSVLVDAELTRGDVAAAVAAARELASRADGVDVPALRARAAAANARVAAATGDLGAAVATLEAAADQLDPRGLPWLKAMLLVDLADLRERSGDAGGAAVDAKAAASILTGLDVVLAPEITARLARLCDGGAAGAVARSPAQAVATLVSEGKWWRVSCGGTSVSLPTTKGLRYLAELLAAPGAERHALDLVDRVEGVAPAGGPDRRKLGDAGELVDGRARDAYRRRVEELRGEIDDALAVEDLDRAEVLQTELDRIVAELAAAFGLGGRERRAGSPAEKARLNVTRAIRAAIAKIAEALPEGGAALDRGVRTGLYCAYEPAEGDQVWAVQR